MSDDVRRVKRIRRLIRDSGLAHLLPVDVVLELDRLERSLAARRER